VRDHLTEIPPFRWVIAFALCQYYISSLIVADWQLHYIIQNFKRFPHEISMAQRASPPPPMMDALQVYMIRLWSKLCLTDRVHETLRVLLIRSLFCHYTGSSAYRILRSWPIMTKQTVLYVSFWGGSQIASELLACWQDVYRRRSMLNLFLYTKRSAVAEMGDRGHNRHGPKRGGRAAVPLSRGSWVPI